MENDENNPKTVKEIITPTEENEGFPLGDALSPARAQIADVSAPEVSGGTAAVNDRGERREFDFYPADWLALAFGIALSVLWHNVFDLMSLAAVPGLGTTAFVLAALGAECVYLGKRLRPTRSGIFLAASTALIAVASGLFQDYTVRMVNLALLSFLTPASALALAWRDFPALEARMIPETVRLFLPNLFRDFTKPFLALRRNGSERRWRVFWVVVLSLVLALPLFILILYLLSQADEVFKGLLGDIFSSASRFHLDFSSVWRVVRTAVFSLMLFSLLYSLAREEAPREASPSKPALTTIPFIVTLAVLDVIYAVFAVIQFVYLFGGMEAAAMEMGYAQYARQGFFQLVGVAVINSASALACSAAGGSGKKALNALVYTLIGLTAVILASALYRMLLYIGAYGLSLLRCMTLLIMVWIAVSLICAFVKTRRPDFKVFPVLAAAGLAGWILFNYVNIDRVIASHNLAAFERGELAAYDVIYVDDLGPGETKNSNLPWQNKVLIPLDDSFRSGGQRQS